ncbi:MAG: 30S ribosomal protein S1, partial [Chloroflexota bacterium]
MTEDKQGGTAPEPEAIAPEANQAPEPTVAAVAVADEPAIDPTADAVDAQSVTTDENPDTPDASARAGDAPAVAAADEGDAQPSSDADEAAPAPAEAEGANPSAAATETATQPEPATEREPAGETESEPAHESVAQAEPAAHGEPTAAEPAEADAEPAQAPEASAPPPPRDLGPEPTTMEELLAEQDSEIKSFKHGDVVEGNVVRIDKDEILVDLGAKSEGDVSNRELDGRHAESQPQLNIGDTVLVYVLQPESQEGHAVLSLRRAGLERKWRSMQEQFEAGLIIEAPVIDHNKGGLIVDCGIRGFVPISQIVDFPRRPQNDQPRDAAQEIAEKLQPFVGRKLRLKILEVNRKANRLILSEKVALYEERREKRDELFSSLQVGQKVTGTVRSIAPFGVFIDLGGIDGLVHKSELSWNKVNNPEAGYKVGEEVEAEVIDINHERGRISLSIRRLQPDPWHSTVADFNVGDVIDGTVTKLVNFGAFVRVRDGLEGLIHISELSHQRVAHPGDVVHEGQQLKLKIISLDSERHRLGLSLKQAEEPPARPAPEAAPAAGGARGERRPRPERGYSMSDAVQEPEGGIDNTLAAAFAQVREQVAASEEAQASDDTSEDQPAAGPTAASVEDASAAEAIAGGEAATEPEAVAETEALTAVELEPAAAEPEPEPEPAAAEAEPEPEPAAAEAEP